jgi:hypothetical protein
VINWISGSDDCRSTNKYCIFFLVLNLISWSLHKLIKICSIFFFYCHNVGLGYLFHFKLIEYLINACTKHIKINYHSVRNKAASNSLIVLRFASSEYQIANIFTKLNEYWWQHVQLTSLSSNNLNR